MVQNIVQLMANYCVNKQDDVISKPFRIPELIPKIEELVAKYNTTPVTPPAPPPVESNEAELN